MNIDDLKNIINDLSEDHREEGESLEDAFKNKKGDIDQALNDIAEDHREMGKEKKKLKNELSKTVEERDQAYKTFMQKQDENKEEKGTYGDIK